MIHPLQLRLSSKEAYDERELKRKVSLEIGVECSHLTAIRIKKRSLDARQRQVFVNVSLDAFIDEEPTNRIPSLELPDVSAKKSVIVVGAGPAGLFAALKLIELGLKPIVLERGKNVSDRKRDIAQSVKERHIDPHSNACFGEGGAGAFSDGKLYTRSKKRGSVDHILLRLCQHGASENILYEAHPHIGTDKLPQIIANIRNTILSHGGEIHFSSYVKNLLVGNNRVIGVQTEREEFLGDVILATGHSARDTYRMLYEKNIPLLPKSLAIGVRLEHPRDVIDCMQYHTREGRGKYLPSAEYSFVTQVEGRGVYSFCMCPGGVVVLASSENEQVVVNGMSASNRGGRWSNSGIVVELHKEDLPITYQTDVLGMMHYQDFLERQAFEQGGGSLLAPVQRMEDFIKGRQSNTLPHTSFAWGCTSSPLHQWLPSFISHRLREGFLHFSKTSRGFLTNEALLLGVETRTSSPLRIPRDEESLQHISFEGLYPCGEGAGYSGGIVSAAIDGERCAEAIAGKT